jgi:hypothetical protein
MAPPLFPNLEPVLPRQEMLPGFFFDGFKMEA